jgi:hypothetical protein
MPTILNQITDFYHVLEDTEKRENRNKKLKRKLVGIENEIKGIMPTNTHRTKLTL